MRSHIAVLMMILLTSCVDGTPVAQGATPTATSRNVPTATAPPHTATPLSLPTPHPTSVPPYLKIVDLPGLMPIGFMDDQLVAIERERYWSPDRVANDEVYRVNLDTEERVTLTSEVLAYERLAWLKGLRIRNPRTGKVEHVTLEDPVRNCSTPEGRRARIAVRNEPNVPEEYRYTGTLYVDLDTGVAQVQVHGTGEVSNDSADIQWSHDCRYAVWMWGHKGCDNFFHSRLKAIGLFLYDADRDVTHRLPEVYSGRLSLHENILLVQMVCFGQVDTVAFVLE